MLGVVWRYACLSAALFLAGCGRAPEAGPDAEILSAIQGIQAIDVHAHPVRLILNGPPDREFDALPVDNMEPESDPIASRPDFPGAAEAARELYGGAGRKQQIQKEKGDAYPAWALDRMGIGIMFANRVAMGPGVQPPRFRWVPYADPLIFPLDNSKLAQYLSRVVTPTLERQQKGGALAEKFEAAYLRSLNFDRVDRAEAGRVYGRHVGRDAPSGTDYKALQDFLFRYIAAECGRLGMAVHLHTMAGSGGYFDVACVLRLWGCPRNWRRARRAGVWWTW
jgi:hypothetical protein